MTSNEQHFKRDAWLSGRHRVWGRDVPAMDLDFILAEYDRCVPMALIDYKHEHGAINFQSANIRTLVALGDMAGLPAFIVRYGHSNQDGWWGEVPDDSTPWFQVIPLNSTRTRLDYLRTTTTPSSANSSSCLGSTSYADARYRKTSSTSSPNNKLSKPKEGS
jgi:hypothetical protein